MVRAVMIVMKFGGSSVADRSQIDKVRAIVQGHVKAGRRPVVVCSAHKGITDALVQAARRAASGHYDPDAVIARQEAVREGLGVDAALLAPLYQDLRDILRGLSLVRELSARSLDLVSSFGERFSVRVIAAYFAAEGLPLDAALETALRDGLPAPPPLSPADRDALVETYTTSARPADTLAHALCSFVAEHEGSLVTLDRRSAALLRARWVEELPWREAAACAGYRHAGDAMRAMRSAVAALWRATR